MTAKERKQLEKIEWNYKTGTSDRQQARDMKLSLAGFYMRWCSLHKKRLSETQND